MLRLHFDHSLSLIATPSRSSRAIALLPALMISMLHPLDTAAVADVHTYEPLVR